MALFGHEGRETAASHARARLQQGVSVACQRSIASPDPGFSSHPLVGLGPSSSGFRAFAAPPAEGRAILVNVESEVEGADHGSGQFGQPRLAPISAVPARRKLPAPKEEVASNTESDSASQDVVQQIRAAATERFNGPEEVMQAVRGPTCRGRLSG